MRSKYIAFIKTMENFKGSRQEKLECKTCVQRIATRLKQLETALKKSKRVCKCFQPLHAAKCPLTPCYSGEKRWPGSDGHISYEDMLSLNRRRPPPKWWWHAHGHQWLPIGPQVCVCTHPSSVKSITIRTERRSYKQEVLVSSCDTPQANRNCSKMEQASLHMFSTAARG